MAVTTITSWTVKRNDQSIQDITVKTKAGTLVNISTWSYELSIKASNDTLQTDDDAVILKSGNCSTNPFTVILTPTDTNIAPKKYKWDILFYTTEGVDNKHTASGVFEILDTVTKGTVTP